MDLMPHPKDPTTNAYNMWYDKPYDMFKQPILDFGCIVMAHVPLKDQGMLTGRAIETYYVGPHEHGRHGGLLLYNPQTKHTIVRRTFRVMGPMRQSSPQLYYEAAYDGDSKTPTYNTKVSDNLPAATETPDEVSLLLDDCYSDDKDAFRQAVLPVEELVPQFGNDYCIENDPIPSDSDRRIKPHEPKPPPAAEIAPAHFVVEKIINHKGTASRPGSMHLFVKWLGYDDTENSWIKWEDNQDLAAIDTYLANNPDIEVPVFEKRIPKTIKEKKKEEACKCL
jgi:hypothetical protein